MIDVILGAGISGRILKHFLPSADIYESSTMISHPNSSMGANYLWKELPGFNCLPITVYTTVDGATPTKESIRRYKNKVGKENENEEDWRDQFEPVQYGFITGHKLVAGMYGMRCVGIDLKERTVKFDNGHVVKYRRLFSTLPLPTLVKLCGWILPVDTLFKYRPVYVKVTKNQSIVVSHMTVNYVSDPCDLTYRQTIRFGETHSESLNPYLGTHTTLYPGKIWNSPATKTVLKDLARDNVYCFGRYAIWNSDELIHQTYEKVQAFLKGGN